jgi:hypothetical protein
MPPNFANAKIYAIRSHQTEQIYIGSTTQPLYKRFSKHKTMYCSSKEIMKFEDCYIELLQEFPCANKMQLNRREGELIRSMDCINKNIAGRTDAEYRDEHKTESKQYRDEHKEQTEQYDKQRYQDNKQAINEKTKRYYQDNKQEINEKQNQKYNCACGGKYRNNNKQQHFKTTKHLEFIRQLSA